MKICLKIREDWFGLTKIIVEVTTPPGPDVYEFDYDVHQQRIHMFYDMPNRIELYYTLWHDLINEGHHNGGDLTVFFNQTPQQYIN